MLCSSSYFFSRSNLRCAFCCLNRAGCACFSPCGVDRKYPEPLSGQAGPIALIAPGIGRCLTDQFKDPGSEIRPIYPEAGYLIPVDRKSTRLNSSHVAISYAVFCLKKKKKRV